MNADIGVEIPENRIPGVIFEYIQNEIELASVVKIAEITPPIQM